MLPLYLVMASSVLVMFCFIGYVWLFANRFRWGGSWKKALWVWLGRGRSTQELCAWLGIGEDVLRDWSPSYREVSIPKRTGSGTRTLSIPDEKTKDLQRKVLRRVLTKLRAHPSAHGFERGRSIATNAMPHVGMAVVIKMDIVNFFASTTEHRIETYFKRVGWNQEAARLLTKIVTYKGGLPQGAPTSPRISNLVNFYLDVQCVALAKRLRGSYTRYADDLTFSFQKDFPKKVRGLIRRVTLVLKRYGYTVNRRKLRVQRSFRQQRVTGLIVNERLNVPRSVRRRLRAIEHYHRVGKEATLTPEQLQGWRGVLHMVRQARLPNRRVNESSEQVVDEGASSKT
jgi:retron-type reverse transcriptase